MGFSQITMILPFLLMILHFSHIFFTEGLTFTNIIPFLSDFGSLWEREADAFLLCPPCDPAAGEVIRRHLNGHLIAREDADEVHSQLA